MTPRLLVLIVAGLLLISAPFTANALEQTSAAMVLALIGGLLLRPEVVPVVPLALGYQWLQTSVATIYANSLGISLHDLIVVGAVENATFLGHAALAIAAAICAFVLPRWAPVDPAGLRESLARAYVPNLFKAYGVALMVSVPADVVIGVVSQLAQMVQGLEALRFALLVTAISAALVQRKYATWVMAVIGLEVVIGLSGFFASFALPLLYALLAFVSVFTFLRANQRAAALGLSLVLVVLGVMWNAVKNDYRREVSGYSGEQVVTVGLGERYSTLGRMASRTMDSDVTDTLERFATRLGYVEYFGIVLDRVPRELPHRDGDLLKAALMHIFVPRVIFPDKPPLPSDSELTAFYTANVYLLYMPGTSISLGYVTEGYIDFGVLGVALMAVMLAALMTGVIAAYRKAAPEPALALSLSCSALMSARLFETALPKLLGGIISVFIVQLLVLLVLRRWVVPVFRGELRPGAKAGEGA